MHAVAKYIYNVRKQFFVHSLWINSWKKFRNFFGNLGVTHGNCVQ